MYLSLDNLRYGIGMSEEFLEHIFEPFAQEKKDARSVYQGTGLGMAIVKSLLDEMGGKITITSKEGVGSVFVIEIPFKIAPPPIEYPEPSCLTEHRIHDMHLLLAEDNDLNAEIAQALLADRGAKVMLAADGQQALELFRGNQPGTFDAILMDGLAATKAIRELERSDAKTIPIIAMTANAFQEDVEKCLAVAV